MASLPSLMAKIELDERPFESGINKSIQTVEKFNRKMQQVSASLKKSFTAMENFGKKATVALAGVAGAITGLAKAAGTLETSHRKLKIVTAGNTKALNVMEQASQRLARTTNYNSIQYRSTMASAYAMGKNYDFTAGQISNLVSISADLGTIYSKDLPDATERIMAAMRGEAEAAEALGLSLSQTAVEHWMMEKGIKGVLSEMSLAQQAQIRYQMLLDKTRDSMGAAQDMTDTFEGTWERLKNTFVEAAANTGTTFLDPIKDALNKIIDFLNIVNQSPALQQFIADAIKLGLVFATIGTVIGILGKIGNITLTILTTGFSLLTNPITWVVALIAFAAIKVEGFAETWKEAFEKIKNIWIDPDMTILDKIGASLGTVATAAITSMQKVGLFITETLGGDVNAYMEATNKTITGIQNALNSLSVNDAETKLQGFVDLAKELFNLPGTFTLSAAVDVEKSAMDNLLNIVSAAGLLRLLGFKGKTAITIGVGLDLLFGNGWTGEEWVDNMIIKPIEAALVGSSIFGLKTGFGIVLPIALSLSGLSFVGDHFAKDIKDYLNGAVKPEDFNFLQKAFQWSEVSPLFKGFGENLKKLVSNEDLGFFGGIYAAALEGAITAGYAVHEVISKGWDIIGWIGEKISDGWNSFVEWGQSIGKGIKEGLKGFFSGNWLLELIGVNTELGPNAASTGSSGGGGGTFDSKDPVDYVYKPTLPDIYQRAINDFTDWFASDQFTTNPVNILKASENFFNSIQSGIEGIFSRYQVNKEIEAIEKAFSGKGINDYNLVQLMMKNNGLIRPEQENPNISIDPKKKAYLIPEDKVIDTITPSANVTNLPINPPALTLPETVFSKMSFKLIEAVEPIKEVIRASFVPVPKKQQEIPKLADNALKREEIILESLTYDRDAAKKAYQQIEGYAKLTSQAIDTTAKPEIPKLTDTTLKREAVILESLTYDRNTAKKMFEQIEGYAKLTPPAMDTTAKVDIPPLDINMKDFQSFIQEYPKNNLVKLEHEFRRGEEKLESVIYDWKKDMLEIQGATETPPAMDTTAKFFSSEFVLKYKEMEETIAGISRGISSGLTTLEDHSKKELNFDKVLNLDLLNKRMNYVVELNQEEMNMTESANNTTTALKNTGLELKDLSVEIPELTKKTKNITIASFEDMKTAAFDIGSTIADTFKSAFDSFWTLSEKLIQGIENKNKPTEVKGINFNEGMEVQPTFDINIGDVIGRLFDPDLILRTIAGRMNSIGLTSAEGGSSGFSTMTEAVEKFGIGAESFLNKTAGLIKNMNTFVQNNTKENDSMVFDLIRDIFDMMTELVSSLAASNTALISEMGGLNAELQEQTEAFKGYQDSLNTQNNVQDTMNRLTNNMGKATLNADGTLTGPLQGQMDAFAGTNSKMTDLNDATANTTNALNTFESKLAQAGASILETLNPVNIVSGWLGSLNSGLQGLISAIDPIAAIFRGINKALAPVLDRLMKPLEHLGFIIGKALIPVVEALIPVFTGLAYIVAGIWNAFAAIINMLFGWLGVNIATINFQDSWEEEQSTPSDMTNTAGYHQPVYNTFNVTFTGNTVLDSDDEAMETLAEKFLQYCREHDVEVVTG